MKCLVLFLFCGVLGELPVTTILPELEPETLTDSTNGPVEELKAILTIQAKQSDVDYENEISTDSSVGEILPASTDSSTTEHFTQLACNGHQHMEWNSCGPRCYQTCAFQPRGSRVSRAICESVSTTNCYPGCFCKSGYVHLNEKCVLPVECPTRSCIFANEIYSQCGSPCPLTCDSYNLAAEIESQCPTEICVRGCFCKPGYVRSATGLCVLPTRCPRPIVI